MVGILRPIYIDNSVEPIPVPQGQLNSRVAEVERTVSAVANPFIMSNIQIEEPAVELGSLPVGETGSSGYFPALRHEEWDQSSLSDDGLGAALTSDLETEINFGGEFSISDDLEDLFDGFRRGDLMIIVSEWHDYFRDVDWDLLDQNTTDELLYLNHWMGELEAQLMMGVVDNGHMEAMADGWNALMHALYGNIPPPSFRVVRSQRKHEIPLDTTTTRERRDVVAFPRTLGNGQMITCEMTPQSFAKHVHQFRRGDIDRYVQNLASLRDTELRAMFERVAGNMKGWGYYCSRDYVSALRARSRLFSKPVRVYLFHLENFVDNNYRVVPAKIISWKSSADRYVRCAPIGFNFGLFSVPQDALDKLNQTFDEIREKLPLIQQHFSHRVQHFVEASFIMLGGLTVSETMAQRAVVVVQYAHSIGLVSTWVSKFASGLTEVIEALLKRTPDSSAEIHPVGLDSDFGGTETVIEGLIHLLGSFFECKTRGMVHLDSLRVKAIKNYVDCGKHLKSIVDFLRECFRYASEFVMSWVMKIPRDLVGFVWKRPNIRDWVKEVVTVVNQPDPEFSIYKSSGRVMQLRRLLEDGERFLTLMVSQKVGASESRPFFVLYGQLKELFDRVKNFAAAAKHRRKPFVIYLYGSPGVGKTNLTEVLMQDIWKELRAETPDLPELNTARDVYARDITDNFWSGYANQPFVLFDDFLQAQDPAIRTMECATLVKIINNAPCPLNMADLQLKGTVFFDSPFIIINSNTDIEIDLPVTNVFAVRRRRDVVGKVCVYPSFRDDDGMPDGAAIAQYIEANKLRNEDGSVPSFLREVYMIDEYDNGGQIDEGTRTVFIKPKVIDEGLTYDAFLRRILDKYKSMVDEEDRKLRDKAMDRPVSAAATAYSELKSECTSEEWSYTEYLIATELLESESAAEGYRPCVRAKFAKYVAEQAAILRKCAGVMVGAVGNKFVSCIEGFMEMYFTNPIVQIITGALSGIVIAEVVLMAIEMVKDSIRPKPKPYAVSGEDNTRFVRPQPLQAVSGEDRTNLARRPPIQAVGDTFAEDRVLDNVVSVMLGDQVSDAMTRGVGIFIMGRTLMIPQHILYANGKRHSTVLIERAGILIHVGDLDDVKLDTFPSKDIALLTFRNVPCFPDITTRFIQSGDLEKECVSVHVAHPVTRNVQVDTWSGVTFLNAPNPMSEYGDYRLVKAVLFQATYSGGKSGSVVFCNPKVRNGRTIMGLLTASGAYSVASLVTQEFLAEHLAEARVTRRVMQHTTARTVQQGDRLTQEHADFIEDMGMPVLGLVEECKQVRQCPVSDIIPSALHGVLWKPVTKPAMLRARGELDPMRIGLAKYGGRPLLFCERDVVFAARSVALNVCALNSAYKTQAKVGDGMLSDHAMLNGVQGDKYIKPMDLSTSPGYPWMYFSQKPGKKGLVITDGEDFRLDEVVARAVEKRLTMAERGIVVPTVYMDYLKDERRPLEKVDAGKTRVFNICPLDLNLALRKAFGYFNAHVMATHLVSEIAVGVNNHSVDWGVMFEDMDNFCVGDQYIGGDFSNFDGKMSVPVVVETMNFVIFHFYPQLQETRKTLIDTLMCAHHLNGEVLYRTWGGNPSGNAMTVILNSLVNMVYMRLAWMVLAAEYDPPKYVDFEVYVRMKFYGDDLVGKVSILTPWYNMVNISHVFARFGVKFTSSNKDDIGDDMPWTPRADLTFLKRGFVKHDGEWRAPLALDSIHEMINWIRKCPDETFALVENVKAAKMEMFHYGRTEFSNFCVLIDKELIVRGVRPPDVAYDAVHSLWRSGELTSVYRVPSRILKQLNG